MTEDAYAGIAACFLGPKAENGDYFLELLEQGIREHMEVRKSYYSDEEPYIDQKVREKQPYINMQKRLNQGYEELCNDRCKEAHAAVYGGSIRNGVGRCKPD